MDTTQASPIPLVIYGVPFHNVTFDEAVEWVVERARSGRPSNIATANLDFVTKAWHDPELQRILIDADLVLADGFPIVKLAPFFGPKLKDRVTGSDITPMLAERAAREGLGVYGLGAADGIAEKAMAILKQRYPSLIVKGTYSPPFTPLLEMDHRGILRRLEAAKPDILFVALGAPKQDKFISMHVRGWNVPVSIGIGGSLDFITGRQKRAPVCIQHAHLEWLWRLCSDPRRFISRYIANVCFLCTATRQMWQIHRMKDRSATTNPLDDSDIVQLREQNVVVELYQPLKTEDDVRRFISEMEKHSPQSSILIDVHATPWLNSLELGALLEVSKMCRKRGNRVILFAPRPKVRRLFETCRLDDYFDTLSRIDQVDPLLKHIREDQTGHTQYEEGLLTLELPLELTAATLPDFEQQADFIHHELKEQGILKTVTVDAGQLDFIDSAGLGFLIALKKTTQDEGVSMSIANLAPRPRRTFEIARVDKILLHT